MLFRQLSRLDPEYYLMLITSNISSEHFPIPYLHLMDDLYIRSLGLTLLLLLDLHPVLLLLLLLLLRVQLHVPP